MGCDDPDKCPETKNYAYMMTRKFPQGRLSNKRGIGLSQISNEDDK
jgi:sulfite reductase beta subunit-like hemoprotein